MRLIRLNPVPTLCTRAGRIGLETTVAVAIDFESDDAEVLVELGVEIAALMGAGLLLVHAVETGKLTPDIEQNGGSRLQQLLAPTDHGAIASGVQPMVAAGRADEVILAAVDRYDVDLLIMGTGQHPLSGIGTVAESVLPQLECSVLTVPTGWEP